MTSRIHYYGAVWCEPCKQIKPHIISVYPDVIMHDMDDPEMSGAVLGLRSVPAIQIVTDDGSYFIYGPRMIRDELARLALMTEHYDLHGDSAMPSTNETLNTGWTTVR